VFQADVTLQTQPAGLIAALHLLSGAAEVVSLADVKGVCLIKRSRQAIVFNVSMQCDTNSRCSLETILNTSIFTPLCTAFVSIKSVAARLQIRQFLPCLHIDANS